MQTRLYFAYGSNMNKVQMRARCPGSKWLGSAVLPGYRWIIAADGFANAVPAPEDTVEGVLFEITQADEAALDIYEEVDAGCYAKHVVTLRHAGTTVEALVYLNPLTEPGTAAPAYLEPLRTAMFVDAGLSEAYLSRYILPFIHP
ncbi:MAG: gamma-glutamylcyclotransferase family protein [Pseudohongiellaceae bacterium]